jgi:putative transposase
MKTSRFSDAQIIAILKQAESGSPVPELCREHGISSATFYKWRSKFGGMDASLMARLKELEEENRRLKKMYAEERLKAEIISEAMAKSGDAHHLPAGRWRPRLWLITPFLSVWLARCSR